MSSTTARVERRRRWWANRKKGHATVDSNEDDAPKKERTKSLEKQKGLKAAKQLTLKKKTQLLVSRQGFKSSLARSKPLSNERQVEAFKVETKCDNDSDDDSSNNSTDGSHCEDQIPEPSPDVKTQSVSKEKKRYILFVGNLPYSAAVGNIMSYFAKHGAPVKEVRLLSAKATGQSKGCCFLEFENSRVQQNGLRLHHKMFEGRRINVEVTCGGGGNNEARKEKIKKRNLKVMQLRQRQGAVVEQCQDS